MYKYTIQEIFQKYGDEYVNKHNLSKEQWKVFNAIRNCATKNLGYHICICEECGEEYFGYNSCRNRHCPMCQNYARERWIQKESSYLLDSAYFHIITTVPYELNEIFIYNQKLCYDILFKSTSETILKLCEDPKWLGAKVGITSILHTWGQTLQFHPHIHSIVTGGGLKNNHWVTCNKDYLFKVQVLGSLFRGKFLYYLKHEFKNLNTKFQNLTEFNKFLEPLYKKIWITYIEPPKGKTENVIEYVGRYSFRVAISNERIKNVENGNITFEYKDYKDNGKIKIMKLSAMEFLRRFFLHVLPKSFTKIKHYGLFANSVKKKLLHQCKMLIQRVRRWKRKTERVLPEWKCPSCGSLHLSFCFFLPNRS